MAARSFSEQLVPDDSFLRKLPHTLAAPTRMKIDGLVFAADAISHNLETLREAAQYIGSDGDRVSIRLRTAMLVAAWSIIDNLEAIRQILSSFRSSHSEFGPNSRALFDALEPVRQMRNKMDHLAGNIRNLANSKGNRAPLFGSLSYVWCDDPNFRTVYSIVIQTGLIHGKELFQFINPTGETLRLPADLFQLEAFGIRVSLRGLATVFRSWLEENEGLWRRDMAAKIANLSQAHNVPEANLWAHSGGNFHAFLKFTFGDD